MATVALGFIREAEKECKLSTAIPNEIIHLILLFLFFAASDLSLISGDVDIKTIIDSIKYRYFENNNHDNKSYNNYTWIGSSILIALNLFQQSD